MLELDLTKEEREALWKLKEWGIRNEHDRAVIDLVNKGLAEWDPGIPGRRTALLTQAGRDIWS